MHLRTPDQLRAHLDQLNADRKNAAARGALEGAKALEALQRLERAGAMTSPTLQKIAQDALEASEKWRQAEVDLSDSMASVYKRIEDLVGPAQP